MHHVTRAAGGPPDGDKHFFADCLLATISDIKARRLSTAGRAIFYGAALSVYIELP